MSRTRLPEPIEIAAYYVIAESLTNAAKHAEASLVEVDVGVGGGAESATPSDSGAKAEVLAVAVRDDGRGGADAPGSGLVGSGTGSRRWAAASSWTARSVPAPAWTSASPCAARACRQGADAHSAGRPF